MKNYIFILFLLACSFSSQAADTSEQFDELLNKLFEPDGPGGVALVIKDGKPIYRKAFGMADLELNVKMTPDNIFRIGSISKQFTAVAILKLAEEGKIDLNADITEYVKDYPTHGYSITIKHLLNHTSGIKSYTGMQKWDAEERKRDFTPIELIDYFKNEPMDFAPGEQFKYNNSGYVLLGHIIELVSGDTYANYIENHLFKPLGLKNSHYGSTSKIIKNRASGYDKADDTYKNADFLSMTQPYAAGSLLSTVDDVYAWYMAIMNDQVISKESREMAHQMGVLNNGDNIDYGFGWFIGNIQGSPLVEHGGGINGYLTSSLLLPKEDVFVAVFSNCNCNSPGAGTANKIAGIAIGKPFSWDKIKLKEDELRSYQGVYEKSADDVRIFTFEDGQLYSLRSGGMRYKIHPFAKDQFFFEDGVVSLSFNRDSNGELSSVTLKSTGQDQVWMKTDKPIPSVSVIDLDEKVFKTYIGKYELAPNFHINIFSKSGQMFVVATGQEEVELLAIGDNKLMLKDTDIKITMNSTDDGVVNSLTLHQNGDHLAKKIE
ncbi:MAG: CubicO group peptidase (beta-lactamase class C family) [Glaciecola sp.]|jgi:CubicO group peptidase (beta-lactamase class C family)